MARKLITEAEGSAIRSHIGAVTASTGWNLSPKGAERLFAHTQTNAPLLFWFDDDEDTEDSDTYTVTPEGVAIIPVHGVLIDSAPSWWMSYLGYCSTPQITDWVREAGADANVKSVFLDVDSPGGQAAGMAACSDALFALRGVKTAWAGCREACSAAFYIASQAERVFLTKDGVAGCIGTVAKWYDSSVMYREMGVEAVPITNAKGKAYKGVGMRGAPLTPEQRADQARVCDEIQELFDLAVSRGRGMELSAAQELATGQYYIGANALALNLVDEIADVDEALTRLGTNADSDGAKDPAPQPEPVPGANRLTAANTGKDEKITMTWENFKSLFQGGDNESSTDNDASLVHTNARPKDNAPTDRTVTQTANAIEQNPPQGRSGVQSETTDADAVATLSPAERSELAALRTFRDTELSTAREAATASAVRAFGQDTPELTRAKAAIAGMHDVHAVRDLAGTYQAVAKVNVPNVTRQTANPSGTTEAEPAATPDAEVFNNARETGEKANKTGSHAPTDRKTTFAPMGGKRKQ